jgi:acetyl esterase/lipase
LDSEDGICARIAVNTGVVALNVNYRHTPEYGYPTAWNDAEDAMDWVKHNAERLGVDEQQIIVGGISAGGWLSASLVQTNLRRRQPTCRLNIIGQILMIPSLVNEDCYRSVLSKLDDPSRSSYKQNEFAPILSVERIKQFNALLKVDDPDSRDRRLNPGNATAEEVEHMPPTTIGVAGLDPLRDEALLYGKLLAENR